MAYPKLVLVGALLLLVAACSSPVAPDIWVGETTNADTGAVQELRLEVVNRSDRWAGSYFVNVVRGAFDGIVEIDGSLTATLTVSGVCSFELNGTVNGDNLNAVFLPVGCPGGSGGSWVLVRQ